MATTNSNSRYSRQERFAPIGAKGQARIQSSRALVVGCGALGSMIAERLVRAGIGALRIVDRDWVEVSNLQRQTLFDEADAAESKPKAIAACDKLRQINGHVEIDARVEEVDFRTIQSLGEDCDVVLDGTDNFETRFLVNDFCVAQRKPWVHAGCLGASGQIMTIRPDQSACFRCLVPELPPREATETCDSAGVLGPAIGIIASWQAGEALKLISGNEASACSKLIVLDTWNNDCRMVDLPRSESCVCCRKRKFEFLEGSIRTNASVLCGKNAVQLESPSASSETLESLAARLDSFGEVRQNAYFVKLRLNEHELTIFRGGRIVVSGTTVEAEAKNIVARLLGG